MAEFVPGQCATPLRSSLKASLSLVLGLGQLGPWEGVEGSRLQGELASACEEGADSQWSLTSQ